MKTRLRVLILVLALLVGLPLLAWTGTFFYWHFRITSAMREWKKAAASRTPVQWNSRNGRIPPATSAVLMEARCRALPYLVRALDDSTDPEFQEGAMNTIIMILLNPPSRLSEEELELSRQRYARWSFIAEGLTLEREERLSDFRAWWRDHGREHHQWWRVWSSDCRGTR